MLHLFNTALHYTFELSHDFADVAWVSEYPACINQKDGSDIYEGIETHKFDYQQERVDARFFVNKPRILLTLREMNGFILAWYDACVKKKMISNCVNRTKWMVDYQKCFSNLYENTNVFDGALGYYETLALHDIYNNWNTTDNNSYYVKGFEKLNAHPEISWIVEDYLTNGRKSVWENYLTEYIRNNVRNMKYSIGHFNRAKAYSSTSICIDLKEDITISEVDFKNPQAIYYFDNPFDMDFHTNYVYLVDLFKKL